MVVNIDPYDTPWVTMAPKVECAHTTHEWLQDTLCATNTGGAAEGAAFAALSLTARTRVTNVTQIFRKDIDVSDTQRVLSPYGIQDEYAYQIMKATREIARNIESRVFAASGGSTTGGTGVARVMKNLSDYITTNAYKARSAQIGFDAATTCATLITEERFNRMLEKIYSNGGNPDTVFAGPPHKRMISKFGGAGTNTGGVYPALQINIEAGARSLTRAVNTYVSDFGLINVVLDRWCPVGAMTATTNHTAAAATNGQVFFLERTRNRLAFLRPIKHVPMGKAADSTRGIVAGELTLEALAQKGSGVLRTVANLDV